MIIVLVLGLLVGGLWAYYKFIKPKNDMNTFDVVPQEAIFVVQTDNLSSAWTKISSSEIWEHLKTTQYFSDVNEEIMLIDKFLKDNAIANQVLGERKLLAVGCNTPDAWDLLYIVDLKDFANVFNDFKSSLKAIPAFTWSERELRMDKQLLDQKIYTLKSKDDPSLIITFTLINNALCVSLNPFLVDNVVKNYGSNAWDKDNFKVVNESLSNRKSFKFYLNSKNLTQFYKNFSMEPNEIVDMLASALSFTATELEIKDNKLDFSGYTSLDSLSSYISAFAQIEPGRMRGYEIASCQTAAYFSLCFESFDKFYSKFMDEYAISNPQDVADMNKAISIGESLLGISLKEDFLGWIGSEIAICKLRPLSEQSRDVDAAVLVQAKTIDMAMDGLERIVKHINRRTPIKFEIEPYKNYDIKYLEMKGFFKMFFGKLFKDIEKPYFTYIENYVVFANSQEVLKQMIDDYILGRTLSHDSKFNNFRDEFDQKSNITMFIQMPKMYKTLYEYSPVEDRKSIEENKEVIASFARVGFQLVNDNGLFKTNLLAEHDATAYEEDEADKIENAIGEDQLFAQIDTLGFKIVLEQELEDGLQKIYWEDSTTVKYEGNIKNGNPHGLWRSYYDDGSLMSAVNYDNGKVHGIGYFYYDKKGNIVMAEVNFENDKISGDYLKFYDSGSRMAKIQYKDGLKNGVSEYYHKNGNLKMTTKYKKGEKNEKSILYDQKGNKIGKQVI